MDEVFSQANRIALQKYSNKELIKEAIEECQSLFWSAIVPIHFIAEQEFLKVYDWYDEHNLIKFKVKTYLLDVKKEFDKFQEYISANYDSKAYAPSCDLANNIYGGLQKEILDLRLTFKFYMERKKMKNVELKSQIQLVLALLDCWKNISDGFFDRYKEKYCIDFSSYYPYADLTKARQTFKRFYTDIVKPECYDGFDPAKNYASKMAFNALADKLVDSDFVDEQSIDALIKNNCMDELAEIFEDTGIMKNAKIIQKSS